MSFTCTFRDTEGVRERGKRVEGERHGGEE